MTTKQDKKKKKSKPDKNEKNNKKDSKKTKFDIYKALKNINALNLDTCFEVEDNQPEEFRKIVDLWDDAFGLTKNKKRYSMGESSRSVILANLSDAESSKIIALISSKKGALSRQFVDAYRQNPIISHYLDGRDVFQFASIYEKELNKIVDELFTGNEKFEQIVSRCQNYAQFSTIYALDSEIPNMKKPKKRYTEFENEFLHSDLRNTLFVIQQMVGLGQSAYIAMFGGRTVCTGIASLTASIMDLAFKKCNLDAKAISVRTDDHAVVEATNYTTKRSYIVDPTNYAGSFKNIAKIEGMTAKQLRGKYKEFNSKRYDAQEHFVVVNYFMEKFKIREKMNKIVKFNDAVPIKLAKIMCFMENNLSPMSKMIYPKAVLLDGYEVNVKFCFEMCLNGANVAYKTGCGVDEFTVIDGKAKYYIDTYRAFSADNKVNDGAKFIYVKKSGEKEKERDL